MMGRTRRVRNYECDHSTTEVILTPHLPTKYAKLVCTQEGGCNKMIKWLPDPNKERLLEERREQIQQMLDENTINAFERGFLENIINLRTLSPKQFSCFNGIVNRNLLLLKK